MTEIRGRRVFSFLFEEVSGAPLVVFRFAFGIMMFLSTLRFMLNGWVDALYVQPGFFFTFYGFEWVKPLGQAGMYTVFAVLLVTSLMVAFGWFYRVSIVSFFLLFTYVELIDKSNYLNHYYFISVVSFLLCLMPAVSRQTKSVPRWTVLTLQLQMAVVYFFAGIAKINTDWLLNAMPLKIWLPAKQDIFLLGNFVTEEWAAYVFSWCGMLFDTLVPFFLFNRKTVWYAYAVVIVFHILTSILFPFIGVFPFVMIVCATVFLPEAFHAKILRIIAPQRNIAVRLQAPRKLAYVVPLILALHFLIQAVLPFRYLLYPDKLFYNEEGFRFSWRVMLMEKAGHVFFHVKDGATGKIVEVNTHEHLTMQQQKQMSTQPDMILQFAHYLRDVYAPTMTQPEVYAEAYVTVNGRGSRLLIDPTVNLAKEEDNFAHKEWILAQANTK
jgi:hypothetical protein